MKRRELKSELKIPGDELARNYNALSVKVLARQALTG